MGVFHFLNVRHGDCSVIQHPSKHVTVVDVYNAFKEVKIKANVSEDAVKGLRTAGNFNQKDYPVNPIAYMRDLGIENVFRFILTHPDMDHMGGIKDFFEMFGPTNFWDTGNTCEKNDFCDNGPHDEDDWLFYKYLRDGNFQGAPKRLVLHAGASGKYYNQGEDGNGGGDGLHVLAPTEELINAANNSDNFNDASYVILYRSTGGRILLAGNSHDATWEHILENHADEVRNVDLLIAPHHGRKSGRSYDFLDVVNPNLTFFGNANSDHLAYNAWSNRELRFITNNQANCMIVDTNEKPMKLYVTNKSFARKLNSEASYSHTVKAYYCGTFGH